jgi:hypothetical protein
MTGILEHKAHPSQPHTNQSLQKSMALPTIASLRKKASCQLLSIWRTDRLALYNLLTYADFVDKVEFKAFGFY